ncbi:MAG: MBL fold metallo-hydrolase [Spirochaetes bacterium]|nr:MBL fold metallo-hydrolase [Spirochaetota bacterium]
MKTRITVLCENSVYAPFRLIAEHGLSFFIENEDVTLFDTGQGLGIINNMTVMGKDVRAIQRIILSHGHYDHTGGLFSVLEDHGSNILVFAHPAIFNGKYAHHTESGTLIERYIGLPKERMDYEKAGAEFNLINGYFPVTKNLSAISEIKRPSGWKCWDARLKQKINDTIMDDPFLDDLSLLLETDSGPVVLLGCAHAGIIEILDDISSHTGYKEFFAVIGGTHLGTAPKEYVAKAFESVKQYKVKIIAPSHCTGFNIECLFAKEFKEKFRLASAGSVFEF